MLARRNRANDVRHNEKNILRNVFGLKYPQERVGAQMASLVPFAGQYDDLDARSGEKYLDQFYEKVPANATGTTA